MCKVNGVDASTVVRNDALSVTSRLLQVPEEKLMGACTHFSRAIGLKMITSPLSLRAGYKVRDAMAKQVYQSLFESLVSTCSDKLRQEVPTHSMHYMPCTV